MKLVVTELRIDETHLEQIDEIAKKRDESREQTFQFLIGRAIREYNKNPPLERNPEARQERREQITAALAKYGSVPKAALSLGLSTSGLSAAMESLNIDWTPRRGSKPPATTAAKYPVEPTEPEGSEEDGAAAMEAVKALASQIEEMQSQLKKLVSKRTK